MRNRTIFRLIVIIVIIFSVVFISFLFSLLKNVLNENNEVVEYDNDTVVDAMYLDIPIRSTIPYVTKFDIISSRYGSEYLLMSPSNRKIHSLNEEGRGGTVNHRFYSQMSYNGNLLIFSPISFDVIKSDIDDDWIVVHSLNPEGDSGEDMVNYFLVTRCSTPGHFDPVRVDVIDGYRVEKIWQWEAMVGHGGVEVIAFVEMLRVGASRTEIGNWKFAWVSIELCGWDHNKVLVSVDETDLEKWYAYSRGWFQLYYPMVATDGRKSAWLILPGEDINAGIYHYSVQSGDVERVEGWDRHRLVEHVDPSIFVSSGEFWQYRERIMSSVRFRGIYHAPDVGLIKLLSENHEDYGVAWVVYSFFADKYNVLDVKSFDLRLAFESGGSYTGILYRRSDFASEGPEAYQIARSLSNGVSWGLDVEDQERTMGQH